ncbi:lactate dehydrogenase [Cyanobium gracile]|uniref:Lactate dehydrogenase n=1 Tax=Cyanobium gracile UHCC 0281 TaxID=3110309 RepID=A0ABU5SWL3_9CYAN|nr:lactate dehydrogenase [Cyanobium gracile]MEA5442912.1 lactate dehydrogenase [Cyanobium gracile UHCC 0281]
MANEQQPREARRSPALLALGLAGGLVLSLVGGRGQFLANVQFENCVTAADGSITCDTVPTGNTLMNDVDARYGLLQNASPGWSEFEPYQGYDDDFGGNET